ncbi:rh79 [macacine betaherpesvirus 3]|uniref:Rh79 n=1 Tax=Rhesus cytomegalovirus (strain 68-1) TaxID=47929 RepID=Q7TFQ2_RHCM6|nr:rh79 [macacine betaherpesvirus 3]AAP50606.1 rh79 [macacine betaherpesvirus 3]AAZ80579.1 rh79 [macacine betaherpesvirus 3]
MVFVTGCSMLSCGKSSTLVHTCRRLSSSLFTVGPVPLELDMTAVTGRLFHQGATPTERGAVLELQAAVSILSGLAARAQESVPVPREPQQPWDVDGAHHHGGVARPRRAGQDNVKSHDVIVHRTRGVEAQHRLPADPQAAMPINGLRHHLVNAFFNDTLTSAKRAVHEFGVGIENDTLFLAVSIIEHGVQGKVLLTLQLLFAQVETVSALTTHHGNQRPGV